jgi:hypothetical protein
MNDYRFLKGAPENKEKEKEKGKGDDAEDLQPLIEPKEVDPKEAIALLEKIKSIQHMIEEVSRPFRSFLLSEILQFSNSHFFLFL